MAIQGAQKNPAVICLNNNNVESYAGRNWK